MASISNQIKWLYAQVKCIKEGECFNGSVEKTSDIKVNDGATGVSKYAEHNELSKVATSNNYEDLDNKPIFTVVENEYPDMPALYADQDNQTDSFIQYVEDASLHPDVPSGAKYFEYLGTTAGFYTDYRMLSDSESDPLEFKIEKTSDIETNDGATGASPYAEIRDLGPDPTGLEGIIENSKFGYRFVGRPSGLYQPIGWYSIDMTYTDGLTGYQSGASGDYSLAFQPDNHASGDYSTVFGYGNQAQGVLSFVTGQDNVADGFAAVVHGVQNTATDRSNYMLVSGVLNHVDGYIGAALGGALKIKEATVTAVGYNNTDYTPRGNVLTGDVRRFIVGTGEITGGNPAGVGEPADGFIVYKSGEVNAPSLTKDIITNAPDGRVLVTREYLEENGGGGDSGLQEVLDTGNRAQSPNDDSHVLIELQDSDPVEWAKFRFEAKHVADDTATRLSVTAYGFTVFGFNATESADYGYKLCNQLYSSLGFSTDANYNSATELRVEKYIDDTNVVIVANPPTGLTTGGVKNTVYIPLVINGQQADSEAALDLGLQEVLDIGESAQSPNGDSFVTMDLNDDDPYMQFWTEKDGDYGYQDIWHDYQALYVGSWNTNSWTGFYQDASFIEMEAVNSAGGKTSFRLTIADNETPHTFLVHVVPPTLTSNLGVYLPLSVNNIFADDKGNIAIKGEQIEGSTVDAFLVDLTSTYTVDWSVGSAWRLTRTAVGATVTIEDANLPLSNRIITIYMEANTGTDSIILPSYWYKDADSKNFIGSQRNRIIVECLSGANGLEDVRYSIQNI